MPVGFDFYDQEHDAPAQRGNVVDLWAVEEDWEFPTYGALALEPTLRAPEEEPSARKERPFGLKAPGLLRYRAADGYDEAPGFAARARQRQREEARRKPVERAAPRRSSSLPAAASSHYS